MTYCLAIRVQQGLVLAADTRTNAGVDYVSAYRKLFTFAPGPDRVFFLLAAGSLATTQELCHWIERDLAASDGRENLRTPRYLFEAAAYLGRLSRSVQERHAKPLAASGVSGETTLILGGEIQGGGHELFLIYPQGNCVEASEDTPYLQIGENKYGKPMLDRLVAPQLSLADAGRLAMVSLDATIKSNLSVGPPIDMVFYTAGTLDRGRAMRFALDDPDYTALREHWQEGLMKVFSGLPPFDWEQRGPGG